MSATKPADLTLAIQKETEGFTAIDKLTLTHNLWGFILPSERYKQIYKKVAYFIPPGIALYDDIIDKDATRTEVHRSEGKH